MKILLGADCGLSISAVIVKRRDRRFVPGAASRGSNAAVLPQLEYGYVVVELYSAKKKILMS